MTVQRTHLSKNTRQRIIEHSQCNGAVHREIIAKSQLFLLFITILFEMLRQAAFLSSTSSPFTAHINTIELSPYHYSYWYKVPHRRHAYVELHENRYFVEQFPRENASLIIQILTSSRLRSTIILCNLIICAEFFLLRPCNNLVK